MMDSSRLVVLVDGSSYLFRAFNGLPDLRTKDGRPTNVLQGVASMLLKAYEDYRPAYFGVIFDAKGKTFRHEWYAQYKANRPPAPADLVCQIEPLHRLVRAMGFPLLSEQGVEADDVIGTLTREALKQDYQVMIVSGDKDFAQLLTHADVTLVDTMKNQVIGCNDIAKRFKVDALTASQVVDLLALKGDAIDNIPGVPGVGEKTAAKWLQEYGDVEHIIAHATKIKGKVGESLCRNIEQLRLSYKLAKIRDDLDLPITFSDLVCEGVNAAQFAQLCDEFELYKLKARLLSGQEHNAFPKPEQPKGDYQLIQDEAALKALCAELAQSAHFSIDCETDSLNYLEANLVGVSLCGEAGKAYYIPVAHKTGKNLEMEILKAYLQPLLLEKRAIGQNLKYDRHVLSRYGFAIPNYEDTMLMSYCLNSSATRHNMDDMAQFYLNYQTLKYDEVVKKGMSFADLAPEDALFYAAEDADITLRLYTYLQEALAQTPTLCRLYEDLERPLLSVLEHMEKRGVAIDVPLLEEQSQQFAQVMDRASQEAYAIAGCEFSLNSPKQLREILFDKLALPSDKKTAGGAASTSEAVLEHLMRTHENPLPEVILRYRHAAKLKSTYTDALPRLRSALSHRVHTSYHQAVTSTGRLSSSEPNLQNIPIRGEDGRAIRQAFIAKAGSKILAADYSQIELRILAHLSGDERLQEAFLNQEDVHQRTASEIFDCTLDQVDGDRRRRAKSINFGLMYGMSAFGLAKQLNISNQEASAYIKKYFARYPKIKDFMESLRACARAQGYVETLMGRRIYIADIHSRHAMKRQAAERLAINAPMQGSAADIIKLAMLKIEERFARQSKVSLIMQVHDELVFEIAEDFLDEASVIIKTIMQEASELSVPMEVSVGVGDNWQSAH